jgi:ADP-ribose pyrophosphatase YjhB (NUDIX family)|tara:strand:+ start:254 stop:826 length:573 start_codon:yes stop_codon:yes gene_type:complete
MKFCSQCGNTVEQKVPEADNRLRFVCVSCDMIHYQNPNIVSGTLPVYGDKILLCKRAIEPRYGYWTLPAGFMENKETTSEAAIRETWEEAEAIVEIGKLFSMISVPQVDQVHIFFLARLLEPKYAAGSESLEVELFSEDEIPWEDIAFPTVKKTLKLFFADREKDDFGTHVTEIIRSPRNLVPKEHNEHN